MRRLPWRHSPSSSSPCALVAAATGSAASGCPATIPDGFGPFGRGSPPVRASIGKGHVLDRRRPLVPELQADPRRAGRALAGEREGEVRPRDERHRPDRPQRPVPRSKAPTRPRTRAPRRTSTSAWSRPATRCCSPGTCRRAGRGEARSGWCSSRRRSRRRSLRRDDAGTSADDVHRCDGDQQDTPRHRRHGPRATEPAGGVGPRVRHEPEIGGGDARARGHEPPQVRRGRPPAAAALRVPARGRPARSSGRRRS